MSFSLAPSTSSLVERNEVRFRNQAKLNDIALKTLCF
jgi:hypothetical protein